MMMTTTTETRAKKRFVVTAVVVLGAAMSGALFSRWFAIRSAERYGAALGRLGTLIVPRPDPEEPVECAPENREDRATEPAFLEEVKPAKKASRVDGARASFTIGREVVERASRSKRLRGEDVDRGVRISGVSRIGCGLEDGDVVVAIGKLAHPTLASGTDYVLRALARGDTSVSGTIARGDRTFDVVVSIPERFLRRAPQNP